MKDCLGIINLSENNNMDRLTEIRPIAALPFAGRYRIIDFMLSNFTNSNIDEIGIFTKGKFRSLIDHIGAGKPWDLDRKKGGVKIFVPGFNSDEIVQKSGDLEIFRSSIGFIKKSNKKYVILSKSYMICNIDLNKALKVHKESGKDMTIIYKKVDNHKKYYGLDNINIEENSNKLISIGTNIETAGKLNLSMEMYILEREELIKIIEDAINKGESLYLKQALFKYLERLDINTYEYKDYVACINSTENFYNANMDLLKDKVYHDLFKSDTPILTKVKDEPSTLYLEGAKVKKSLVANGCRIKGKVNNSIIFRNVTIKKGVNIENSIIMQNTIIGEDVNLSCVITDKSVKISKGKALNGDKTVPFVIPKRAEI